MVIIIRKSKVLGIMNAHDIYILACVVLIIVLLILVMSAIAVLYFYVLLHD